MISGLGSDITNISRFERSLQAYGTKLLQRILGPAEQQELSALKNVSPQEYAAFIAKRFAAKEACSKALGTGFRNGIYLKDIQTVHNKLGKPELILSDGALQQLHNLGQGQSLRLHLSLSDDYPWAQAFVIIEII